MKPGSIAYKNVKIFILFLLENINYPVDFATLNDIVMQTDYVMYLDFAESFHMMLDEGLIESADVDGETYYYVSKKGSFVARTLKSDILSEILDKSLEAAFRYLDFKKRGIQALCDYHPIAGGKLELVCTITERKEKIFEVSVVVDSEDRAIRMKRMFLERPEILFRGNIALLTGKMNFLFEKSDL